MVKNGTKFDFVNSIGHGPIYWLLWRAYYHNSDGAKQVWNEIEKQTKNEEIEKCWSIWMVKENYYRAAQIISWTKSYHLVAESKMPIFNLTLMKNAKFHGKIIWTEEDLQKVFEEIRKIRTRNDKHDLNQTKKFPNIFDENNRDFLAEMIKSEIQQNSNEFTVDYLNKLCKSKYPKIAATIFEQIHESKEDIAKEVTKFEHPIFVLLLCIKYTDGCTDDLKNLALDQFGSDFRKKLEDDIKFMRDWGHLGEVQTELEELAKLAKQSGKLTNKYFEISEPLLWQYKPYRFVAAFLKAFPNIVVNYENGTLKVSYFKVLSS